MTRRDLQELSKLRVREAKVLLDGQLYAGCYYLCGYAVECAIKAAIAKQVSRYQFPDKDYAGKCFEHDPTKLMKTAGLFTQFTADAAGRPSLSGNWAIVKDWTVTARYELVIAPNLARDMYSAVAKKGTGILAWLKTKW